MRREKISPYLFLFLSIFMVLTLSDAFTRKVRFFAVNTLSPGWSFCEQVKMQVLGAGFTLNRSDTEKFVKQMQDLKRENLGLLQQIDQMKHWIWNEERIEEQISKIRTFDLLQKEDKWKEYFKRRKEELSAVLSRQLKTLPAKVVYRDPAFWSSFVWVDIGERQNRALKEPIIAKNSPVVVGNILVGIVEEVGEKQSKVRLLTDANLFPSVRSVRGGKQNQFFLERIEGFSKLMKTRGDLFSSKEEAASFFSLLEKMKVGLENTQTASYLAKGELQGSSLSLWRTRGNVLRGFGFNYDFADEEGPARDLRTGESVETSYIKKQQALLQEGDLLVTTGLDGVFPPGLEAAIVSKIYPLKEGGSSYEIEAKALAESFHELSTVFILPPVS